MWLNKEEVEKKYPGVVFDGDLFWIGEGAEIEPGAVIGECAEICECAVIGEGAEIGECAVIWECAVIEPGAVIGECAEIWECAVIGEGAEIGEGAVIWECAVIEPGAVIWECARIGRDRKGVKNSLVISGIGETKRLTAHDSDEGLVIVIGCMNECLGYLIEDARKEIAKKYDEDHEYFDALNLCEKWYKNLTEENER